MAKYPVRRMLCTKYMWDAQGKGGILWAGGAVGEKKSQKPASPRARFYELPVV